MDRISKKTLEIFLSKIPDFPSPKIYYEQYSISPTVAARLIWIVETVFNDINKKYVIDLGCGTGRLIIGSLFMNPFHAIGIDIDFQAIKESKDFIKKYLKEKFWRVDFICADICRFFLRRKMHVVLENPPFGVHKKGYDTLFLLKALSLGQRVYTIHKYTTSEFIVKFLTKLGYNVEEIFRDYTSIPYIYKFHKKKIHKVKISVFRVIPRECEFTQ